MPDRPGPSALGRTPAARIYRFVAQSDAVPERLDKFVVAELAAAGAKSSRAAVQRWMEAGRVTLDGRKASASDRVFRGAVVEVEPLPPETTSLAPDASIQFDVLYEDAHLIVIDKPGGLVVHPARGHTSGTLVHGLLARGSFDRLPRVGSDAVGARLDEAGGPGSSEEAMTRPGIVHRLDKGTSGVMVVAKDDATREGLKAQFARHDIERLYRALVVGRAEDRTFDTLHGRHRTQRLKFTTEVATGRRAITAVRVVERFDEGRAALIECRLSTGRTHQIRVHLAECAKTPILGDPLYGRPPREPLLRQIAEQLGRQALHAAVLGFVHPASGQRLRFERDPPPDFMRALAELRAAGRPPRGAGPGGVPASTRATRSR